MSHSDYRTKVTRVLIVIESYHPMCVEVCVPPLVKTVSVSLLGRMSVRKSLFLKTETVD